MFSTLLDAVALISQLAAIDSTTLNCDSKHADLLPSNGTRDLIHLSVVDEIISMEASIQESLAKAIL